MVTLTLLGLTNVAYSQITYQLKPYSYIELNFPATKNKIFITNENNRLSSLSVGDSSTISQYNNIFTILNNTSFHFGNKYRFVYVNGEIFDENNTNVFKNRNCSTVTVASEELWYCSYIENGTIKKEGRISY